MKKRNKASIRLLENGIVENVIKEGAVLEAEDVITLRKQNMKLTSGSVYGVLVIAEPFSSISKEARELTAGKEFANVTVARALVVNSLGHRLLANFYLNINKPFIKTKVFSERETALEWLRIQLQ